MKQGQCIWTEDLSLCSAVRHVSSADIFFLTCLDPQTLVYSTGSSRRARKASNRWMCWFLRFFQFSDMDCESCLFMNIQAVDLPPHWSLVSEKSECLCQPVDILPDNGKPDGLLLLCVMMSVPTTLEQKAQSFRLVLFKHFIICGQEKLEISFI